MPGRGIACFLALFFWLGGAFAQLAPQPAPLSRIAFGSCNREYKPQPLWNAILASDPQVWIWLGDIVYGEADNLPDLERRYNALRAHPGYAAVRERARVLGVWDDHDYGVTDGGAENPHKRASQKLLLDFLGLPPDSPRRAQAGVYMSETFGPPGREVKIILLDGRYFRDEPVGWWDWLWGNTGPRDILGEEQWRWLEAQLTSSTAQVHLIGSGIQVIPEEHSFEKWADFPRARQRLLSLLARTGARNPIFLTGDRHLAEISRLEVPGVPQPVYDLTSSGMTHTVRSNIIYNFAREENRHRVGENFRELNFGFVEIDWEATPATIALQIRNAENAVVREAKFPLRRAPSATE